MRVFVLCAAMTAVAGPATAQNPAWFDKAVQKVEAAVVPAEAKPGQTVTLRVTVHLTDGFHTYPLVQPDKAAAGMVNKLTVADGSPLVFIGEARDPKEFKSKDEPLLGITEMRYLPGKVVYERPAVVSPKAAAGPAVVKPTLRLSVCDQDNCYPAKAVALEAAVKVLDGPPVEVAPEHRDAVNKAIGN